MTLGWGTQQFAPASVKFTFQGRLIKATVQGGTKVSSEPDDSYYVRKARERIINQLITDSLVSDSEIVRLPGGAVALSLTPEREESLFKDVYRLAQEMKETLRKARRGRVSEFSRRSRHRVIDLVNTLRPDAKGLFLTVTYRRNMRDFALAKEHQIKLCKWLRYHFPQCSILWRMERQRRGAIHFHLLVFGVEFIAAKVLTAYWQKMTGDDSYPDIEPIQNQRKALFYVAKYMTKPNHSAHERSPLRDWRSMDLSFCHIWRKRPLPGSEKTFVGRWWGVVGRVNLPVAEKIEWQGEIVANSFFQFRRAASVKFPRLQRFGMRGFTLYADAHQWRLYWQYCEESLSRSIVYQSLEADAVRRRKLARRLERVRIPKC